MAVSESTAQELAREKLLEYGLRKWQFKIDRARQRLGSCQFAQKRITISKHLLADNSEAEFMGTLLHEIAHALVGPGHAHDALWQQTAQRIGAKPHVTNDTARMPHPRWAVVCTGCEQIVARRHRRSLNLSRVRCRGCPPLKGELTWQDQPAHMTDP